jgi:anti-sigma factor RsiW
LTRTRACAELRHELGVYLLGAIPLADRSAVDSHLASCSSCRDELADLAGLPALLRRVSVDEVDGVIPAGSADCNAQRDEPLGSLLKRAARCRRHRVWSEIAIAAAAGLAAGAAAAFWVRV